MKTCFQHLEGNGLLTRILSLGKLSSKCKDKIRTFQEFKFKNTKPKPNQTSPKLLLGNLLEDMPQKKKKEVKKRGRCGFWSTLGRR